MNRSRPRIVHVIDRLALGGMESVALTVIERTADLYEHHIVCLRDVGAQGARARQSASSVASIGKQPGKDPRAFLRLVAALRRLRPDLVQTYNIGTIDVAFWAQLAGVRRIVHAEHGRDAADPSGRNRKYRWLRRAVAPLVARFVAVSADLERWMREDLRLPAGKVRLIRNGIDTTRFAPPESDADDAEAAAGLAGWPASWPRDAQVIGSVGRLDPVKGFATLIDAFAIVHERSARPVRLVLVGEGPEHDALVARVAARGLESCVWFAGSRGDTPALLATMDVYVCSSIAEGIALTMLEAMACARPIVATRVGGNPELITHGENGLLVASADAKALAAAIEKLLVSPAESETLGAAARRRASADFSLEAMVAGYRRLYDELTGRGEYGSCAA